MNMTKTKIAILGSDNSHAERFPEVLNVSSHPDYWEDSNATVHAIWGEDDARTREVAEKVSIPNVASSPRRSGRRRQHRIRGLATRRTAP